MRLTLLNWNIKCGSDRGPLKNGWPRRKLALKEALSGERFDILSVQEGLLGQLKFLQDSLPEFERVGVGRTDGQSAGEHCAIFFSRKRFELRSRGDFWLSPTPQKPSRSFDPPPLPPRICSWALLKERASGVEFRVFNTHFPLTGPARRKSAGVLIEEMAKIHPDVPAILSGDFNSRPGSAPLRAIEASGWTRVGDGTRTFHLKGVALVCPLDAGSLPVRSGSRTNTGSFKRTRMGFIRPTHFGISATLTTA